MLACSFIRHSCDHTLHHREEQQAMQMPEDSASLGQQQEGGLLKGIFSWKKSKCAFFIQFEKPWIDCEVVCIVVRLAATQHFNMQ